MPACRLISLGFASRVAVEAPFTSRQGTVSRPEEQGETGERIVFRNTIN